MISLSNISIKDLGTPIGFVQNLSSTMFVIHTKEDASSGVRVERSYLGIRVDDSLFGIVGVTKKCRIKRGVYELCGTWCGYWKLLRTGITEFHTMPVQSNIGVNLPVYWIKEPARNVLIADMKVTAVRNQKVKDVKEKTKQVRITKPMDKAMQSETIPSTKTKVVNEGHQIELWVGNGYRAEHRENDEFFIDSNDKEFYRVMEDDDFLKSKSDLLQQIDRATIVNMEKLKIETPYGTTDLKDISTGLKTLLNVLYLSERYSNRKFCVNLDECGNEVISTIFKTYTGRNVSFYLGRPLYIKDFNEGYGRYRVNGIVPSSKSHMLSIMKEI